MSEAILPFVAETDDDDIGIKVLTRMVGSHHAKLNFIRSLMWGNCALLTNSLTFFAGLVSFFDCLIQFHRDNRRPLV